LNVSAKLCTASENKAPEPEKANHTNFIAVTATFPNKANNTDQNHCFLGSDDIFINKNK
jgi:hypothetical protein